MNIREVVKRMIIDEQYFDSIHEITEVVKLTINDEKFRLEVKNNPKTALRKYSFPEKIIDALHALASDKDSLEAIQKGTVPTILALPARKAVDQ